MSQEIGGLIKWASSVHWRGKYDETFALHLGAANEFDLDEAQLDELLGERIRDLLHCAFEDLVSTIDEDGSNIVDDYIKRRGWKEGASTRAYMQAMRNSLMSIYEVSEIVPGASFQARDLILGGAPVLVSERSATRALRPWDRLAARLVTINGKTVMTGAALMLTPEAGQRALDDIARVRNELGAERLRDDPELDAALTAFVLKTGAPIISAAWLRDLLERLLGHRPASLANAEGDPIEFLFVHYRLRRGVTQARIRAALDNVPDIRPDGRNFWNLLLPDGIERRSPRSANRLQLDSAMLDTGEDVYADIDLNGRDLNVLVNSRARAEDVIVRLAGPLDGLVGEPIIEEEAEVDELLPEAMADLPEEARQGLQDYLRNHYLKVLDEPLPRLGDRTPRDAVKTEAGRREVADWLKLLENHHASGNDTGVSYDPGWLWDELKLRAYRK